MPSTLSYTESELVTRADLAALAPPAATATWKPIAHADLIQAIDRQLRVRDIAITKERFAIQRGGARLFAVLDLAYAETEEFAAALGVRNSTDKSVALEIAVGFKVFVCDNLAFSGDLIALRRKHTPGFDLSADLSRAIDRYQQHLATLQRQLVALQERALPNAEAKTLIFEAFEQEIVPLRFFPAVAKTYFRPDPAMTDVRTRTWWGLHNAFTRAVRQMAPGPAFQATTRLGQFFGLTASQNGN